VARKRRPSPFPIRLSPELRARGDTLAAEAELSLSSLFISALFGTPPSRRSRRPHPDRDLLVKIVGLLGNIGGTLNQLAKASHQGSWPDSRAIEQMRADIRLMRDTLLRAFGFTPPDDPPAP
jgi:hypothetical protein